MWEVKLKKIAATRQKSVISEDLKLIKGLNNKTISDLLISCGISKNSSFNEIKPRHLRRLYDELSQLRRNKLIDDSLIEEFKNHWAFLLGLGNWRSRRHNNHYPIRGRTKCNGKTKKRWHSI